MIYIFHSYLNSFIHDQNDLQTISGEIITKDSHIEGASLNPNNDYQIRADALMWGTRELQKNLWDGLLLLQS